jgi:hypothetical protein
MLPFETQDGNYDPETLSYTQLKALCRELQLVTELSIILDSAPRDLSTDRVRAFLESGAQHSTKLVRYTLSFRKHKCAEFQKHRELYLQWWNAAYYASGKDIWKDLVRDMHKHLMAKQRRQAVKRRRSSSDAHTFNRLNFPRQSRGTDSEEIGCSSPWKEPKSCFVEPPTSREGTPRRTDLHFFTFNTKFPCKGDDCKLSRKSSANENGLIVQPPSTIAENVVQLEPQLSVLETVSRKLNPLKATMRRFSISN